MPAEHSRKLTTAERFWAKVRKSEGCWEWIGCKNKKGYGQFGLLRRAHAAHRVAWELAYGKIPKGLHVCHHCDNPGCVRPDHLFLGTNLDNHKDSAAKGRCVWQAHRETYARGDNHYSRRRPELVLRGAANGNAALTPKQVLSIRSKYKPGVYGIRKLAREFGVGQSTIRRVVHGQTYQEVDQVAS